MRTWRITGRHLDTPPADWRSRLATRLGHRPRRVGAWVELALFGALNCLDNAGETGLPPLALLSVASRRGPQAALADALTEAREGLPLPIGFLNSQPNQVLPALAQYLGWQGNGRCLTTHDPMQALALAALEAGDAGLLLGWVEEEGQGLSHWLRLLPSEEAVPLRPGSFEQLAEPAVTCLAIHRGHLLIG